MSRFFDSLMDTKDKRYHGTLILMLAVFGSIAITYIILGVSLCMVKDYDNVFALLDMPYITWTYLARLVLEAMSMPSLSFGNIVISMLRCIGWLEFVAVFFAVICYRTLERHRATFAGLLLLVIEVFVCGGVSLSALSCATLKALIVRLQFMGMSIVAINTILLVLIGFYCYRQVKQYRHALAYDAVEIKELEEE